MTRKIRKVLKSQPTIEGAGVHLKRVFGFNEVPLFDPFLLLDDFRSDMPEQHVHQDGRRPFVRQVTAGCGRKRNDLPTPVNSRVSRTARGTSRAEVTMSYILHHSVELAGLGIPLHRV